MNTINEDELLSRDYNIDINKAFTVGSDILKNNMGGFVGYMLLQIVISLAFNKVSSGEFSRFAINNVPSALLAVGSMALSGMFAPGNYFVAHKIRTRQETVFGDFFYGFSNQPVQFILLHFVHFIMIFLGALLLIFPGVFLGVAYLFCTCVQVIYQTGFWDSLEISRKVVTKIWGKAFLLILAIIGINIIGIIPCGLGLLYTIPLSSCVIYAAFHDIFRPGNSLMDDKISSFGREEQDFDREKDDDI